MKKNRKIVTRIWDLYAPRAKFWAYFPTSPKLKREVGVTFAFNESPFLQNVHCNLQPVKMKPRLAASISALMAGKNLCKTLTFYCFSNNSLPVKLFIYLRRRWTCRNLQSHFRHIIGISNIQRRPKLQQVKYDLKLVI